MAIRDMLALNMRHLLTISNLISHPVYWDLSWIVSLWNQEESLSLVCTYVIRVCWTIFFFISIFTFISTSFSVRFSSSLKRFFTFFILIAGVYNFPTKSHLQCSNLNFISFHFFTFCVHYCLDDCLYYPIISHIYQHFASI